MPVEMSKKSITPSTAGLAAVHMGHSLEFVALRAKSSRSAASAFAYTDGQPAMAGRSRALSVSRAVTDRYRQAAGS